MRGPHRRNSKRGQGAHAAPRTRLTSLCGSRLIRRWPLLLQNVTVSKKSSVELAACHREKSFISIHSTDHLRREVDEPSDSNLDECHVEVLSLKEAFPSTSEESVSNDESVAEGVREKRKSLQKSQSEFVNKMHCVPADCPGRSDDACSGQSVHSDYDIPKSTMFVVGSNPGEPKMKYSDAPRKISKTMKKFMRNLEKHKAEVSAPRVPHTARSILKDGCAQEDIGDTTHRKTDDTALGDLAYADYHTAYGKSVSDKNVKFNTQVVIIHFSGDICLGQSIEALSKEKDQQARNYELRKTFLTKYNEFWQK